MVSAVEPQLKEKVHTLVSMCKKLKANKEEAEAAASAAATGAADASREVVARLEDELSGVRREVEVLREELSEARRKHEEEMHEAGERLAEAQAQVCVCECGCGCFSCGRDEEQAGAEQRSA